MIFDWSSIPVAVTPRTFFTWDDSGTGDSSGLTPPTPTSAKVRGRVGLIVVGAVKITTEV
jgi:hypothetical protein